MRLEKAWFYGLMMVPLAAMVSTLFTAITSAPSQAISETEVVSMADLRTLSLDLFDIKEGYLAVHSQAGPMTPEFLSRTASDNYANYIDSLPRFSGYQSFWTKTTYEVSIRDLSRRVLTNQAMAFPDEQTASAFMPKYQGFYRYALRAIDYAQYDDETVAYYGAQKVGRFTFDIYHVLIRQKNIVMVIQFERTPPSDDLRELDDYVQYLAHRMEVYSPD